MNGKKAYVSPRVIRVKLEPTQAVLSQCSVGATGPETSSPAGVCNLDKNCKQRDHGGDDGATS